MSKVKIFVSHRIDQDSVVLENEIYTPIRCGAFFDKNSHPTMCGDNTGLNISDKREYLGELTVQYWAWKNVDADYYGINHYRRYFSFAQIKYVTDEKNQVVESFLTKDSFAKYGLNNLERIKELVSDYDAVAAEPADITRMHTPKGVQPTVYEHFKAYDRYLVNKEDIDLFLDTLNELYPSYGKSAKEYFEGKQFYGYNCFLLKKELFFELCEMEFSVLRSMEKTGKITFLHRTSIQRRTYGFFCEWMYGIFLYHIKKNCHAKVKHVQLVFFDHTEQSKSIKPISNHIPVVFLTNQHLLPVAQTAIYSLSENKNPGTCYDILILHQELTPEDESITTNFLKNREGLYLRFVNLKDLDFTDSDGTSRKQLLNSVNALCLLPWLFTDYDRVLFLHTDLLVMTDLANLYNTDLNGNWIAAPLDYNRICENGYTADAEKTRKNLLNIQDPYDFFSTSTMLLDLSAIRANVLKDTCIRLAIGNWFSRDTMNSLFSGHVQFLDARWNVCPAVSKLMPFPRDYLPYQYAQEIKAAQDNTLILHFAQEPKPWSYPYGEKNSLFWVMARKVPLYEQLLFNAFIVRGARSFAVKDVMPPHESFPRQVANVFLPKGSMQRELVKKICPKDSLQWRFIKKIYYFFHKP